MRPPAAAPEVEPSPEQCKGCLESIWRGRTGLEPAASGVTGRRSNQLNYDPNRTITIIGEFVNS